MGPGWWRGGGRDLPDVTQCIWATTTSPGPTFCPRPSAPHLGRPGVLGVPEAVPFCPSHPSPGCGHSPRDPASPFLASGGPLLEGSGSRVEGPLVIPTEGPEVGQQVQRVEEN